jgi:hypothetical protein
MTASTLNHGPVTYQIISLDRCLDLVKEFRQARKTWHFHVLSPVCVHNPYPGRYGVVIENDTDGMPYIAASTGWPVVAKDLVKMLHGDDILDPAKTTATRGGVAGSSDFIPRLVALDARGVAWHHHMHFPGCVLSPDRARWTIAIESAESAFHESHDAEPVDVLREVEVLYVRHLERARDPRKSP